MVKGKKSKVINEQHNINQEIDKTLPDDSSTTISRQPLSLRYSNQFWKSFSNTIDNPDDSETSESSLIRSLFKNWYNSGLHFEEYITLHLSIEVNTLPLFFSPILILGPIQLKEHSPFPLKLMKN